MPRQRASVTALSIEAEMTDVPADLAAVEAAMGLRS